MKALILAGGSGTRLWPMSRRSYPKQFMCLNGDKSLLRQTADRLLPVVSMKDIIVVTNSEYRYHVRSNMESAEHIIPEPSSRNTAPAIALGISYCLDVLGCSDDEIIFISPSDHVIRPPEKFAEYLKASEEIAQKGYLVTFGIKPERPETGYGYIKAAKERIKVNGNGMDCFRVERFAEKPDRETAANYVSSGDYFWNSGMFAFSIGAMKEEMSRLVPEIGSLLTLPYQEALGRFTKMPDISIDYAVMERSDRVVTIPLDIYWNDIGSWDAIYDVLEKDKNGNAISGDVIAVDTKHSLIIGNKRQITTIGLEDCLIVETDDAILAAKKGETQKVKDVVNLLKRESRLEVEEHLTVHRPWGSYTVLEEGPRYKIKRIVVNQNAKLSLQLHYHRSEHWVVVSGTAKVTIGEKEVIVHENESVFVPKSTYHRLENPGKVPLEIIEVQNGEYVGEDDIVRCEDIYGRHNE